MSKTEKLEIALEEVRRMYTQLYNDSDILDEKAKDLIAASGIVFTLFAGLQVALVSFVKAPVYYVGLAIIFLFFILTLGTLIYAIRPQEYGLPLKATWQSVDKVILDKPQKHQALEQLISNYLTEIRSNTKINRKKPN